jgi:hypothetical protein
MTNGLSAWRTQAASWRRGLERQTDVDRGKELMFRRLAVAVEVPSRLMIGALTVVN